MRPETTTLGLLVIIGCLIWILRRMIQDLRRGLCAAVTVFVIMPQQLKISIAGLPDFSIQRLTLLLILPFLPRLLSESSDWRQVPFVKGLLALAGAQFLSLIFSVDAGLSIKYFLSFSCEILLFYVILSVSIRDENDVANLVRAVCRGLVVVAILATIEKYWGFNSFVALTSFPVRSEWGVVGTYPHRILFGYAMAMALPMMLLLTDWAATRLSRRLAWLALLLVAAGCYFSTSRGPWLAAGLAGIGMMVLSGGQYLRKLSIMFGLAVVVCIVRPGVWQSISGLSKSTFQTGSLKAQSYEYRWKLWSIALSEIEKSPGRFLFGYGGHSTETMDLSRYFGREEGGTAVTIGFTSWDNNMACDLIEFGIVGFAIEMLIYLIVIRRLFAAWRRAEGGLRHLMSAVFGSVVVYVFALSNVYIYAPQLTYLFWTLVAVGMAAPRLWPAPDAPEGDLESVEDASLLATRLNSPP
jgi:O-antigen ligase